MSAFKIERGIPRPGIKRRPPKYPFDDMEIGESFLVPLNGDEVATVRHRVYGAAYQRGYRIMVREVDEEQKPYTDENGNRCVRVFMEGTRS